MSRGIAGIPVRGSGTCLQSRAGKPRPCILPGNGCEPCSHGAVSPCRSNARKHGDAAPWLHGSALPGFRCAAAELRLSALMRLPLRFCGSARGAWRVWFSSGGCGAVFLPATGRERGLLAVSEVSTASMARFRQLLHYRRRRWRDSGSFCVIDGVDGAIPAAFALSTASIVRFRQLLRYRRRR